MRIFRKKSNNNNKGMTLVEVFVSVFLASVFMSIYVMVVEIIGKFVPTVQNNVNGSEGLIEDSHKLQLAMDIYAKVLAQPGITKNKVINISQTTYGSLPKGCSFNPSIEWDIPVKSNPIENWNPSNAGYAVCLFSTRVQESNMQDLLFSEGKPGIYVLLSIPDNISTRTLPNRKLFCRPSAFC